MCGMLVNDKQLLIVLHHPVCIKQLPDELVFQAGFGVQKFTVKQVHLLRIFHRHGRGAWRCIRDGSGGKTSP